MELKEMEADGRKDGDIGQGHANKAYSDGSFDDIAVSIDPDASTPYVSEPMEEDEHQNPCMACVARTTEGFSEFYSSNEKGIWRCIYFVLVCMYVAYFIWAMSVSFGDEGSIRLLWITCFVVFCIIWHLVFKFYGERISEACKPCTDWMSERSELISWVVVSLIWVAVIIYVIVDVSTVSKNPYNLVSASGIIVYVLMLFVFSHSPGKVRWRPVVWGLALQFVFALIILRWSWGYIAFDWLGARVTEFLAHSDAGAIFLFGESLINQYIFAFRVLPVIIFFSTAISIFYYLGLMQLVIPKLAWIMQVAMGTTAGESMNAAGNIFIGQSEAPLLIRPLIQNMTRSELHAVMTGGFATIAGSVLGAYISFGVPANHLLSASVMSAPAALAMSKLFYPETEKSRTTAKDVSKMEKSPARNIVEAASSGASASISLLANIAVNLIAFLAILNFLNATVRWFGARVGFLPPDIDFTFEFIASYLLWPAAFVMGVDFVDCRQVARLIGLKTFLNEFIAYDKLGKMVANRGLFYNHINHGGNWTYFEGDNIKLLGFNETVLTDGVIFSDRSLVISTYALCGFANFGSIGIMIGSLSVMAPHRRQDLSSIAVRAMIAGNVACFMTACIAGLFYAGDVS